MKAVYKVSKRSGSDCYLVGGSIRDLLCRVEVCDYDFALFSEADSFAAMVAGELGAHFFRLGADKGCSRIVFSENGEKKEADFSPLKSGCIEEDLKRRDFTVNAIACSVWSLFEEGGLNLIDPLGGQGDLEEGRLRLVSEECIDEDPLRILRGFRIASNLSLAMDEGFLSLAGKKKGLLSKVSAERVRAEIFKMFSSEDTLPYLEEMLSLGVLQEVMPELSEWKDIDQGSHHDFKLLDHALRSVGYIDRIISDACPEVSAHETKLRVHLDEMLEDGISRRSMAKLAALLHDSGKPSCLKMESGKVSFHGHEEKGSIINKKIASRLKVGRFAGRVLSNITRQHMRVLHLSKLEKVTPRAMARFIRDCGDETPEVLLLALADSWATRESRDIEHPDVESIVSSLFDLYYETDVVEESSFLKGRDVMRELGIAEGVQVGRYLDLVSEAERMGHIGSREDALEFLRNKQFS
ncbi:MAG: HD domain-containing protein [Proteobacteria bacterium]|nr:HD domain-containing protein [Pseudomonadota bacterium]